MKNETVHEEKAGNLTIKIYPDSDPQSPDEYGDNNLFLVGYHRDFTVERDEIVTQGQCRAIFTKDPDEDEKQVAKDLKKKYRVFGLEAYIHSGVVLALSREGNFPDRQWDVSQLGAVFVSREEWKTEEKARKAALGLIEEWNDSLSGNIYGFVVEDERGEHLESCWGFSGDYDKSGILDEARSIARYCNNPEEIKKRADAHKKADIEEAAALLAPYGIKI